MIYAQVREPVIHSLKTGEDNVLPTHVRLRGAPKWLPDGRSILITSPLSGKEATFYRVDPSTGKADLLHTAAGPVRVFDLSPDGKTIFYVQALCGGRFICTDPPRARLVRLDIESGRETELRKGDIWSVAVSPDGKQLAFLDQEGFIAVMPDAGGEAREVFRGPAWVDNATEPLAWTSDQRYLLFTRDARPEEPEHLSCDLRFREAESSRWVSRRQASSPLGCSQTGGEFTSPQTARMKSGRSKTS